MTVKIVTDSTADLPPQVIEELGITVVPLYVRFGTNVYHDGVDINHDEFYKKLRTNASHPSTSQPTPEDFVTVYKKLSEETDDIISIHLTGKLSGTYNSALQGKQLAATGCRIEVVDSLSVSMGLGLIAITAARLAAAGESVQNVLAEIKQAIPQVRLLALFDSLRYLYRGGRIGKAKALLGSVLNVKPLITMRDGELLPVSQARTQTKGIERLFDFAENAFNIREMAIVHSTTPEKAGKLRERIESIFNIKHLHLSRLGPALGVHGGPGTMGIVFR